MPEVRFTLTNCQGIVLNKLLKDGYKLELEENLNKATEDIFKPKAAKKQRTNVNIILINLIA